MLETALPRLNAAQVQALLDCSNDPAFFLSEGKIVECNGLARLWIGGSRQELVGTSLVQWSAPLQIDSQPASHLLPEQLTKAEQEGIARFDWVFRLEDGTEKCAVASLRLVDIDGLGPRLFCTLHDVTELKSRADQVSRHIDRFRVIFDGSPAPMWLVKGNIFIGCNQAAAKILGYSHRSELLNKHPSELSPPTQPDGEDSYAKANRMGKLAFKQGIHRFEWVHKKANGEELFADVVLRPVEIDLGSVMLCVWRDITSQKKREKELIGVMRSLEEKLESLRAAGNSLTPSVLSAFER
jgi:PAS domain S-box-containing protein